MAAASGVTIWLLNQAKEILAIRKARASSASKVSIKLEQYILDIYRLHERYQRDLYRWRESHGNEEVKEAPIPELAIEDSLLDAIDAQLADRIRRVKVHSDYANFEVDLCWLNDWDFCEATESAGQVLAYVGHECVSLYFDLIRRYGIACGPYGQNIIEAQQSFEIGATAWKSRKAKKSS